ncbi:MAG: hypothetical protein ACM3YF_01150 [Candidatus Zixiibacteriota bacterium]
MFKKWLAVLGMVVLVVCTFQLLWGGGDGGGEENPWHQATSGGGSTVTSNGSGSTTSNSQTVSQLKQVYIVRLAPMGGFYVIRVSLPTDVSAKTAAGIKRARN